jgi:hypothetical protein
MAYTGAVDGSTPLAPMAAHRWHIGHHLTAVDDTAPLALVTIERSALNVQR